METGSIKRVIILIVVIGIAYFIADRLSNAIVVLFHIQGAIGMVVSLVIFAVLFFAVLHLLQKYAHIVFFGFAGSRGRG